MCGRNVCKARGGGEAGRRGAAQSVAARTLRAYGVPSAAAASGRNAFGGCSRLARKPAGHTQRRATRRLARPDHEARLWRQMRVGAVSHGAPVARPRSSCPKRVKRVEQETIGRDIRRTATLARLLRAHAECQVWHGACHSSNANSCYLLSDLVCQILADSLRQAHSCWGSRLAILSRLHPCTPASSPVRRTGTEVHQPELLHTEPSIICDAPSCVWGLGPGCTRSSAARLWFARSRHGGGAGAAAGGRAGEGARARACAIDDSAALNGLGPAGPRAAAERF